MCDVVPPPQGNVQSKWYIDREWVRGCLHSGRWGGVAASGTGLLWGNQAMLKATEMHLGVVHLSPDMHDGLWVTVTCLCRVAKCGQGPSVVGMAPWRLRMWGPRALETAPENKAWFWRWLTLHHLNFTTKQKQTKSHQGSLKSRNTREGSKITSIVGLIDDLHVLLFSDTCSAGLNVRWGKGKGRGRSQPLPGAGSTRASR